MGNTEKLLSEDEIRRTFFDPDLKKASSSSEYAIGDADEPEWCELSERRLFKKILEHKPAGPMKHYHLAMLHNLLNNVYEDEDTDFEDLLTADDLVELIARRECGVSGRGRGTLVFKPKYAIRPTPQQILDKLDTMYKMKDIEQNEYIPDVLEKQNDYFLPDGEFGELVAKTEDAVHDKQQQQQTHAHAKERKRKSTASTVAKTTSEVDSRCSTPKN